MSQRALIPHSTAYETRPIELSLRAILISGFKAQKGARKLTCIETLIGNRSLTIDSRMRTARATLQMEPKNIANETKHCDFASHRLPSG